MQILAIVLYSKFGERRVLRLEPGQVNIITGSSRTGKSQLIPIVDYCLGRGSCKVARGPIRNTVAWFGLLLAFPTVQMFVARKNPELGATTTNLAFLLEGSEVEIPEAAPTQNTTIDEVETAIDARLGIAPNLSIPGDGRTSKPLKAGFRHALMYCFQSQAEIANPNMLFHRQGDDIAMALALRDTLPYFLGVVQENDLALQQKLRRLRRELTLERKALDEEQQLYGSGFEATHRALTLLSEARQLGLVPKDFSESLTDLNPTVALFRTLVDWTPARPANLDAGQLNRLINQREEVRRKLEQTDETIATFKMYALEAEGFLPAANEQKLRLESIGFYRPHDHNPLGCPVCGQAMAHPTPAIEAIGQNLQQLDAMLEDVVRSQPQLRKQIELLEEEQATLQRSSDALYAQIQALYNQVEALKRLQDENHARLRFTGRLSLWLESHDAQNKTSSLRLRVEALEYEVGQIEAQLGSVRDPETLNRVMLALGSQMTRLAQDLGLEPMDEGASVYLDPVRMALVIETIREQIPLNQLGSGENWLLYHLITHFVLHGHFVRTARPTPRFLFLDQPTQVYFPESEDSTNQAKETGQMEGDWHAAQRLFHFILDTVEKLSPEFQVIISDHANLRSDDRFQKAVREIWRGGNKLIPQSWRDAWSTSDEAREYHQAGGETDAEEMIG